MWSKLWFGLVLAIVLLEGFLCSPVSTSFNTNIRSYSVKEEDINSTAKTLQQEDLGRYANFAPVTNPIRFKDEVPDNALSGSEYSRGLLHHDHGGYGLHDGLHEYDDGHYSYGYDYDNHGLNHLGNHHGHHGHHLGHGYGHGLHHKHYDPALAAKTILWPLAGLAILGTAAALVSNPLLLQLGVISGRRRRDTQEVTEPYFNIYELDKDVAGDEINFKDDGNTIFDRKDDRKNRGSKVGLQNREHKISKQGVLSKKAYQTTQSTVESVTLDAPAEYNEHSDDDKFVPILLKVKKN